MNVHRTHMDLDVDPGWTQASMDSSVLPRASCKVAMRRISDPEVRADAALAQPSHQAKCVIDAVVAPQPVVLAGAVRGPLPRRPCAEASATRKIGEHLQSRRRWCRWPGALSRSVGEPEPRHRILALAMVQLADSALCRPLKPFVFDEARSVRTPRRLFSNGGLVMVSTGRAAGDEHISVSCRDRCRARLLVGL